MSSSIRSGGVSRRPGLRLIVAGCPAPCGCCAFDGPMAASSWHSAPTVWTCSARSVDRPVVRRHAVGAGGDRRPQHRPLGRPAAALPSRRAAQGAGPQQRVRLAAAATGSTSSRWTTSASRAACVRSLSFARPEIALQIQRRHSAEIAAGAFVASSPASPCSRPTHRRRRRVNGPPHPHRQRRTPSDRSERHGVALEELEDGKPTRDWRSRRSARRMAGRPASRSTRSGWSSAARATCRTGCGSPRPAIRSTSSPGRRCGSLPVKSAEQQAVLMLHKARALLVRQRTMLTNAVRAHLAEFGMIAAQGPGGIGSAPCSVEASRRRRCRLTRATRIDGTRRRSFASEAGGDRDDRDEDHGVAPGRRRLSASGDDPGIGPITASALAASVPDATLVPIRTPVRG